MNPLMPVNVFQAETVEVVQWLEDVGHGQDADFYASVMRRKAEWFLNKVTRFYGLPEIRVEAHRQRGGRILFLSWRAPSETMSALETHEPFLYSAFNTPPGLCMCQATPGVAHGHGAA